MSAIPSLAKMCSSEELAENSVCTFSKPIDCKQTALEQCIAKIKQIIQQIDLDFRNTVYSKLDCPIDYGFPSDPVLTNCGHIYNRAAIERWKSQDQPCAVCRTPLTELTSIVALRQFVEERLPKELVPTSSRFTGENNLLAAKYVELAKIYVEANDYKEALECCSKALQYTNSSEVYAEIPKLYDQLGESNKVRLSRFHLSMYQLQEGKIQEAIQTIQSCQVTPLVVGLTLQLNSSLENYALAMTAATNQGNAEDSIFIYKQIIAHFPTQIDAYKKLFSLIKDPKEKRELLLKAAYHARVTNQLDLEMIFLKEAEIFSVITVTKEQWAAPHTINLPPYPQELNNFLTGDCTIWPGKKRWETHIVVPLFPQVDINGSSVPLTLDSLDQLDKSSGGPGYRFFGNNIPKNIPAEQEFHYAVMTVDIVPGSTNRPYSDQIRLLPAGYEAPDIFDAARAILWENRQSRNRYFNGWSYYTRCKNQDYQVVVGGLSTAGLIILHNCLNLWNIGIAGWRKF